jgi:antitoxin YefM
MMQAIRYTEARNNLKTIIGKVCDDYDEYMISTKENKTAVLISYDEYSAMRETMYLLSSKNNRDRLNDAIDQIESLSFAKHDIEL